MADDARRSAADRLSRPGGAAPRGIRAFGTLVRVGLRRDAQRAVKLAKDIMWSRRAQRELLRKLRDLGVPLVSINPAGPDLPGIPSDEEKQ